MDFFDHQEVARKKTGRLVVLFVLAVVAITAMVYLVVAGIIAAKTQQQIWQPKLLLCVGLGTLAVVGAASAYKISELRAGGRVIAESLGGRLIDPGSAAPLERKILNVVEEMAIASGTVVPPVYLMENEASINAFAAGFSSDDAVIGVTRGCIEMLSRDELQGVMAHEFSHILNGDMRLNIRLIGITYGILVIGLIGGIMMRSAVYSSAGSYNRRNRDGRGVMAMLAIGLALLIIGYVGVFFGQMIKAAVSRQREFLADASAVQFSRHPDGIGGALKKIGGYTFGAKITSPNAEEASHMFFGEGVSHVMGAMMATHPPLPQRIRRIEPRWDGQFPEVEPPKAMAEKRDRKIAHLSRAQAFTGALGAAAVASQEPSRSALQFVGQLSDGHIQYAARLIADLPEQLKQAAHEAYGARALIYVLLLDSDAKARKHQEQRLGEHADAQVHQLTLQLETLADQLDPHARLPLVDMALGSLRQLSADQYQAFKANVDALIRADEKVDLFEWVLRRIILRHLEPLFTTVKPPRTRYYSLRPMVEQCALLLSILSYAGKDRADAAKAFGAGASQLRLSGLTPLSMKKCRFSALDAALDHLAEVGPREKRKLLAACAATIAADQDVSVRQGELLRAIADALGCPMPPLLPGQPLA